MRLESYSLLDAKTLQVFIELLIRHGGFAPATSFCCLGFPREDGNAAALLGVSNHRSSFIESELIARKNPPSQVVAFVCG
jgi:hypothetical protein